MSYQGLGPSSGGVRATARVASEGLDRQVSLTPLKIAHTEKKKHSVKE